VKLARGWRMALRVLAIWWVIVGPLGLVFLAYRAVHSHLGWIGGAMAAAYALFTGLGVVILTRLRPSN